MKNIRLMPSGARGCLAIALVVLLGRCPVAAQPERVLDLLTMDPLADAMQRVHGYTGNGVYGVPVAGARDCDGDGHADVAFASFLGSPLGRGAAGEIYLVFGNGSVSGVLDSAATDARILKIAGAQPGETAGSEIWIDDVTGDGIGDLLIGRQSFTGSAGHIGAGGLSVVAGGPALRAHAAGLERLDLASLPAEIRVTTFVGAHAFDRLGIWMRTGDVTGDGVRDILVAADQESIEGAHHAGAGYLIRGGSHLSAGGEVDLGAIAGTPWAAHVARIAPPSDAAEYHLGATCQIADLDGNGRGEVLLAAALNRAGAAFEPVGSPQPAHPVGGTQTGTLYIVWDDNFGADPWPDGLSVEIDGNPGSVSVIRGGSANRKFGEEIVGGLDYNADGLPDLFVGDLTGDGTADRSRPSSGIGYILFNAPALRGVHADIASLPAAVALTAFLGPAAGDISADTAVHGDFDDDGIADIAFSAPHGNPAGRSSAGFVFIFHGHSGPWPALVDLADTSQVSGVRFTEIRGAHGRVGSDDGDVIAYSASAGDVDADGHTELLINEMTGNGVRPGTEDVGNLVVIGGTLLGAAPPCPSQPVEGCERSRPLRSRLDLLAATDSARNRLAWSWLARSGGELGDFGDPPTSISNYSLCVYDVSAAPQPRMAASLYAGLDCDGLCWRRSSPSAYRYRVGGRRPRGVERVRMAVDTEGATQIAVRAGGERMDAPAIPLVLPATVQLLITGAGTECWQAEYETALRNEAGRFSARTP